MQDVYLQGLRRSQVDIDDEGSRLGGWSIPGQERQEDMTLGDDDFQDDDDDEEEGQGRGPPVLINGAHSVVVNGVRQTAAGYGGGYGPYGNLGAPPESPPVRPVGEPCTADCRASMLWFISSLRPSIPLSLHPFISIPSSMHSCMYSSIHARMLCTRLVLLTHPQGGELRPDR